MIDELTKGEVTASDGVSIAFQTSGDGIPLLLLAGQANDHRWWDRTRPAYVAAGFSTITLDWRGTGSSSRPDTPFSMRHLAKDAIAVLDALGVDRAHVYGTSMGGKVAQWLAIDYPTRVDRLALGCTSMGGPNSTGAPPSVLGAVVDRDRAAANNFLADLMYTPSWRESHPGPYHVLGDASMTPQLRGIHARASRAHDASQDLGLIRSATLVLHGADDQLTPASNAEAIVARIPTARLLILDRLRHAYFDEGHPYATRAVLDHLEGHTDGP